MNPRMKLHHSKACPGEVKGPCTCGGIMLPEPETALAADMVRRTEQLDALVEAKILTKAEARKLRKRIAC